MKKSLILIFSIFLVFNSQAQSFKDSVLFKEDFLDASSFVDLSQKLEWGDPFGIKSGFQLGQKSDEEGITYQAIFLTEEAMDFAGYQPNTIRASQAIDFKFPNTIFRTQDTLIIEFDALWSTINNSNWGESSRIVLMLLHDYPEEEIPFGAIDKLEREAPFGRPSYNLRLRNCNLTGPYYSGSFMLYGGGHDIDGEIEQTANYWLPGFSSEPGGGSPGLQDPYPLSPTQKNEYMPVASSTEWRHFTWVIAPERLSFYMRKSEQPLSEDQLVLFMETPQLINGEIQAIQQIDEAHQTQIDKLPTLYKWFDRVEALRIYFRGVDQTYFANLSVTHIYEDNIISSTRSYDFGQVNIFPNPTSGFFKIQLEQPMNQIGECSLFNLQGQLLNNFRINKGEEEVVYDVSSYAPGLYLVRLQTEEGSIVRKIYIQPKH